jgi:hypothetical protein
MVVLVLGRMAPGVMRTLSSAAETVRRACDGHPRVAAARVITLPAGNAFEPQAGAADVPAGAAIAGTGASTAAATPAATKR